jgi:hypothetical protein
LQPPLLASVNQTRKTKKKRKNPWQAYGAHPRAAAAAAAVGAWIARPAWIRPPAAGSGLLPLDLAARCQIELPAVGSAVGRSAIGRGEEATLRRWEWRRDRS